MYDTKSIATILKNNKFEIKSISGNKIIVLVDDDRLDVVDKLVNILSDLGAKYDRNVSDSSIGGVRVEKTVILVKTKGKTSGLDVESAAIKSLQEALIKARIASGGSINIKIKNKTIKDCYDVEKTNGTPKSDFHIVNSLGEPVIFISHKKGSRPNDFQQWSGMTEDEILKQDEIQTFITECQAIFGKKIPPGTSIYKKIKKDKLKMMSVFGVDYGKQSGVNNVDVLIQGDPGLKKAGPNNLWELTATGNIHYNGDLPHGGFDPVLTMIYKGDRDQFNIKGARASIYPIAGRRMISIEQYVKNKR